MSRVLVTGATGFCGRPLVTALAEAGDEVRAAVRGTPAPPFAPAVEIVQADLAAPVAWAPLLAGIDAVIHLAGIAHARARIPDARYDARYDAINHQATAALAQAAHAAGVRHFVFVSSVRAQSGSAADHELTERDPPRPTDAYGRSKLAAEAAVAAAGVPYTILRPVLIYGPGLKGNLAALARLAALPLPLPLAAEAAVAAAGVPYTILRPVLIYGPGLKGNLAALARLAALPLPLPLAAFANRRSLLGLDNLIGAIRFVLQNPTTRGETYLVADPQPASFAAIVAAFRAGHGRPPGLFRFPPRLIETAARLVGGADLWDRLGRELVVDPGKLMAAGWSPARDTKAALSACGRRRGPET
jgi:nucleoside-diphosphate-sugar epimerase